MDHDDILVMSKLQEIDDVIVVFVTNNGTSRMVNNDVLVFEYILMLEWEFVWITNEQIKHRHRFFTLDMDANIVID